MLALALTLLQAADAPKPVTELPPICPRNAHRLVSAISPSADRLALATAEREVIFLNLALRAVDLRMAPQGGEITNMAWSPDGTSIAIALRDGSIVVTDAKTGTPKRTLPSKRRDPKWWHEEGKLLFLADGSLIATALGDNKVDVWSVQNGVLCAQLEMPEGQSITAMCADRAATRLAAGSGEGHVRVWDARHLSRSPKVLSVPSIYRLRYIHALDFDPTGTLLAIGGHDCRARIWAIDSDRPLREYDHCDYDWGRDAGVGSVQFSPDGTQLLMTPCDSVYDLSVWDVHTGKRVSIYDKWGGGDEMPIAAWFSSDGSRIISSFGLVTGNRQADGTYQFTKPANAEWQVNSCFDRDVTWGVEHGFLTVRKLTDETPTMRIPVREK